MSTAVDPWQELIQTCVLGSNRRQPTISTSGGLGELLARLEGHSEEKILMALAATSVAIRTGQLPLKAADLPAAPTPCTDETRKLCGSYSLTLLNHVFGDQSKGGEQRKRKLIMDWLSFCSAAGQRIVPEYLPRLIDFAGQNRELLMLLEECGGKHFRWLLSLNKDWKKAFDSVSPSSINVEALVEQIEIGHDEERLDAFYILREVAPERARQCLEALWDKESVVQKGALLTLMKRGLSMDDEPFLETVALEDKRKEVRTRAAGLLVALPQSRLMQRMQERASQYLSKGGNGKLEVNLPAEFDKDMARDGIEENLPGGFDSRIGQRAGWLYQTLSNVDPAFWLARFGLDCDRFLKLVLASDEWALPLTLGLLNATTNSKNHLFQDAIIACEEIHLTESEAGRTFLKTLPPAKLEHLIAKKLPRWAQTDRRTAPRLDLWYYLEMVDFQWSESFSREILRFIIKEIRERVPIFGHTFHSNAAAFGLRIHPSAGANLEELNFAQQELDIYTRNGLERFVDNLKLRYEMQKSFEEE